MKFMLDINTCIYWFKGSIEIKSKLSAIDVDNISISAITVAELLYGAYNSTYVEKNINKVKEFEEVINILDLDRKCLEW